MILLQMLQLQAVMRRLHMAGLKLRVNKCELLKNEVTYLGFKIKKGETLPTKDKLPVEAITKVPHYKNIRDEIFLRLGKLLWSFHFTTVHQSISVDTAINQVQEMGWEHIM